VSVTRHLFAKVRAYPRQAGILSEFSDRNHAAKPFRCGATGDKDLNRPNDRAAAKAGLAGTADEQHFVNVVMQDATESIEVVPAERA
jgi:hypothetical protein